MKSWLRGIAHRWVGHGPHSVRPFEALFGRPGAAGDVLATVPADTCAYAPTLPLLGQSVTPSPDATRALSPVRRLYSLADAGVAGADGVVYCPRRRIAVEESVRVWLKPAASHPLLSAPGFPAAQNLPGRTLSLGSLAAEGFYHFLVESLPRLDLARSWLAGVDHVLAPGRPGSFQEKWLGLAGVPREKIIWLEGHAHFRCEQLLFTSPLSNDSEPTPWLVDAIRRTVAPSVPPRGRRRLWISRRDAAARQLSWEDELLALLPQFQRVELAGLTPADQLALLGDAACVAGPHGAGLANLVFCPAGAAIIEFSPERIRPVFARLAIAAGCRHAWAVVDFQQPPSNLPAVAAAIEGFAA